MEADATRGLNSAAYVLRTWVRVAASAYALAAVALASVLVVGGARPSPLGWSGIIAVLAAGSLTAAGSFHWAGWRPWALRAAGLVLAVYALVPLADVGVLLLPFTITLLPALVPSRLAEEAHHEPRFTNRTSR